MRKKTIIALIALFVIINIAIYIITEINKYQRIQISLDNHLNRLQTNYEILLYHQRITADAAYKSTISMKKVMDVLSKIKGANEEKMVILRKQLYERLKKKYKILQTKGVLQYHFVLPNNRVFLRVHKSDKFGDLLTDIRYSFKYTNKTHKIIRGFEKGKTTHGFRNVYPIFDKDKNFLASIEISFSSEFLQEYLIKVNKMHTHFLVHKKIFDVKTWNRDDINWKYILSSENSNYMMSIVHSGYNQKDIIYNKKRIKSIKSKMVKKILLGVKFALYVEYENRVSVISFLPINNLKDKKVVAWIVSYDKDDFIQMSLQSNFWMQLILFFLLSVLFYFIYKVVNQKFILHIKVKEKTTKLRESEAQLKLLNKTLASKIRQEVKKNQEKDRILFQQSKMASMGEMIGNIAHQWRQPISIISMWANNIIVDIDMEEIDEKNLRIYADNINKQTLYLSQTIDDFRKFFIPNREKSRFTLKKTIDKTIKLLTASFKRYNIEVIMEIEEIEIEALENELTQAILNIIKNAKDILEILPRESEKLIFIKIYHKKDEVTIKIKDNGGGIKKEIINKVFEPYFTTKHKSLGTGIGLYMTQSIITKHLNGEIYVHNVEYEYCNQKYKGAEFIIKLLLD